MAKATGKDHARINLDIWGDDPFLDLSPRAQHLYFTLWTDPQLTYCGSGDWHPGKIASRAHGCTAASVEAAGSELSANLFLVVDVETAEFLLRSWIKHDGLWRIPNMAVSMANARAGLASRTLRGVVVHEVKKLVQSEPDLSSWTRDAVAKMLKQNDVDPGSLPAFIPAATPVLTPPPTPGLTPGVTPQITLNRGVGVNPPANPGPTPTPTPAPTPSLQYSKGGYVTGEPHQGAAPDLNGPRPTCDRHAENHTGPCDDCRRRRAWDEARSAADADRQREAEAQARQGAALARALAIAECDQCDDDGYRAGVVCGHNPEQADTNARGMAAVRAALGVGGEQ